MFKVPKQGRQESHDRMHIFVIQSNEVLWVSVHEGGGVKKVTVTAGVVSFWCCDQCRCGGEGAPDVILFGGVKGGTQQVTSGKGMTGERTRRNGGRKGQKRAEGPCGVARVNTEAVNPV